MVVVVADMVVLLAAVADMVVLPEVVADMVEAHLVDMKPLLWVVDMAENLQEEIMVVHLSEVDMEEKMLDMAEDPLVGMKLAVLMAVMEEMLKVVEVMEDMVVDLVADTVVAQEVDMVMADHLADMAVDHQEDMVVDHQEDMVVEKLL